MKLLKLVVILVLIIIGLASRHHSRPHRAAAAHPTVLAQKTGPRTAINQEILQNAERLTETLRRCQQTAQKNKETR